MRNSMALKQSLSIFSSTNPVFTLKQISLTPTFYSILDDRMLFPVANDFKEVFRDDKVVRTKREQKPFFQLKFFVTQAPDVDLSNNPYADGIFKFNDQALLDEINLGNKVTT